GAAPAPAMQQPSSVARGAVEEEEIEMDDLPVRATAPEHLIGGQRDEYPSESDERPRREPRSRGERRGRDDRRREPDSRRSDFDGPRRPRSDRPAREDRPERFERAERG